MHRLEEKEVLQRFTALNARFAAHGVSTHTLDEFESATITAHRQPTAGEVRFGYGAIHYKTFPLVVWVNPKTGKLKKWIKCECDGLRYYRGA